MDINSITEFVAQNIGWLVGLFTGGAVLWVVVANIFFKIVITPESIKSLVSEVGKGIDKVAKKDKNLALLMSYDAETLGARLQELGQEKKKEYSPQ